jgi:hypothetical protein
MGKNRDDRNPSRPMRNVYVATAVKSDSDSDSDPTPIIPIFVLADIHP